ncbi:cell division suppressor protein YneA [Herbinix luporum]|jgi:cell division protein YceG involved in septum cleavage|uniref:LysM domain-containing protein n=1 Tax=Herbinix luporum TaxID=1679721 RepID=A0A0K8J4B2_9FIRM|nr:LysM peptidoglycan-binding domain-containing protein [Herbinix luporum]MDI9488314.1 LysM peptidoglycan-binding domain-containing protein [Bacillota bacterium]CUH92506.1 hypothetical protein SD1D_0959 [Herbinix luporum]HHT57107.1 LysM peptidoglycan-binding domain-containing protein [Herbinix luporum]
MNKSLISNFNSNHEPIRNITDRRMKKSIKWIGLSVLIIIILLTAIFTGKTATAKNERHRVKQVASVQIQKGDSLWTIASRYMTEEYKDINDYIEDIMICNGLTSDKIHAGNYIIVPYYVDLSSN